MMFSLALPGKDSMVLLRFISATFLLIITTYSFSESSYRVGAGIADVTGAAHGIGMMGYAKPTQMTEGIHTRLFARSFVIEDPLSQKRIVLVSADLGMIFESVKLGVINKLQKTFGKKYSEDNVLISATHTHSGPGGYAFHTLYNITIGGFYQQNYDAVVNGIVESIVKADAHLEPANIFVNQGELINASRNRSLIAYGQNPPDEQSRYQYNTDKSMLLLKFENDQGVPIGMINWFAVHGVSMSNENTLISGDNKGVASMLFEQDFVRDYRSTKPFVAAFMQANEGDVTPNIFGQLPDAKCSHFDCGDFKRTLEIGKRQYEKARLLFESAHTPLSGKLDYRHQYLDMKKESTMLENGEKATGCASALGYSFAAGTTDGVGSDFFYQGELQDSPFFNFIRDLIAKPTTNMKHCHAPKPILLAVGRNKPHSWVPDFMPVQLFTLGELAIIAGPGEFTTMAGRRIKDAVLKTLSPNVQCIAFAGLSNSYAGYITTYEEYQQQNYEGGSTVFGPYTSELYKDAFVRLANALKNQHEVTPGPKPSPLSNELISFIAPVLFDDTPPFTSFGDVHRAPHKNYHSGEVVHVSFWAGNPRNNLEKDKSFLEVQRLEGKNWQTIYHDWDLNTIFRWHRVGLSYAHAELYWKVSDHDKPGIYRILHHGHYLYGWNRNIYAYIGESPSFRVTS